MIFGLNDSQKYAKSICDYLKLEISLHTEKSFADGEQYLKSNVSVRDADVYVISSLYRDSLSVGDKLMNLLYFIGSLKDASARHVTFIAPYIGFRQDRKTESRAPVTTKYMAQALESVGVDRVLTIDVHSLAAFQNAFRIPVDNLDTTRLFVDYLTNSTAKGHAFGFYENTKMVANYNREIIAADLTIVAPDIGGLTRCGLMQHALNKRIQRMCKQINEKIDEQVSQHEMGLTKTLTTDKKLQPKEIPLAIFDKRRVDGDVVGSRILGDVKGRKVLIFDDLIASGSTIAKAAKAVEDAGGEIYKICATHGQFIEKAMEKLAPWKDRIVCTDTIKSEMPNVIPTAQFVGKAIKITHEGESISQLLEC